MRSYLVARPDGRAARLVGRRQVDARQHARRPRADAHGRPAARRPRPAHDTPPPAARAARTAAILVDTPGLRELQLWEGDVDSAFSDIAELAIAVPLQRLLPRDGAGLCRPARRSRRASSTWERMRSYRKLERELRAIEARSNKRVGRELKRRWKARARETRQERKYGKRLLQWRAWVAGAVLAVLRGVPPINAADEPVAPAGVRAGFGAGLLSRGRRLYGWPETSSGAAGSASSSPHQVAGDRCQWSSFARELSAKGYRAIVFDMRGDGAFRRRGERQPTAGRDRRRSRASAVAARRRSFSSARPWAEREWLPPPRRFARR